MRFGRRLTGLWQVCPYRERFEAAIHTLNEPVVRLAAHARTRETRHRVGWRMGPGPKLVLTTPRAGAPRGSRSPSW
jgi:hypothetical protein